MVGENGTGLAKSLTFMAGADAAGIVLGARVPVLLTSPADSLIARLAFCAVAGLVAAARRQDASKVIAWSCVLLRGHVASGCAVFLAIHGTRHDLWRAVDQDGTVLDMLVQRRRTKIAANTFFRKLLKGCQDVPRVIVTDKLKSYNPAK